MTNIKSSLYKRFVHFISKDLTTLGVENYKEIAMDKERWKKVCIAAMDLNGL